MVAPTDDIILGLERLEQAKQHYLAGEPNSTEAVLDAARYILAAGGEQNKQVASRGDQNEKPSDFLQRVMWAEVSSTVTRA